MNREPTPNVSMIEPDMPIALSPIKKLVTEILQLPIYLNTCWDVIDYYPNEQEPALVLAHYNENYDPYNRQHDPLRRVRGVVIDVKTKAIVADSYGYTQSLPCYGPIEVESGADMPEGKILVQTEIATYLNSVDSSPEEIPKVNLGMRSFDGSSTKLFLGYEGAMARVFKWNEEVFFSTHRRINAVRSNWGGRTAFYELYQRLNGPPIESLFGDEPYSPYCYMFLIVDDDIRIASSTRDNRVIFIGMKKVWSPETFAQENGPYAWSGDFELRVPESGQEPGPFSTEMTRALTIQPVIDSQLANKFLFPHQFATPIPSTSTYDAKENEIIVQYNANATAVEEIYFKKMAERVIDERLAGGDFVILYHQAADGNTFVYRLEPTAFEYRAMITANDPNLYHRFVVEMVNFTKADPLELRNTYPRYDSEKGSELSLDDPVNRQVYWWSIFYDAVPPSYRNEVDVFLTRYNQDLDNVARFILKDYPKIVQTVQAAQQKQVMTEREQQAAEELRRINADTQKRFEDLQRIVVGASYKQSQPRYEIMRSLLMKETGPSVYKMITVTRGIRKFRDRQTTQTISVENIVPPQPVQSTQ